MSELANLTAIEVAAPSGRRRRQLAAIYLGGNLLAVAVITAGAVAGCWFVPFIIGFAFGLTAWCRLRFVVPATGAVAMAGWVIPLVWQAWHGVPVVATAWAVAGLAGLPASAALILGATLLTAALQALTGLWLGRASRRWATEFSCWATNPGRTRRSRSSR
jgi:hypothetical protein